MRIKSLTLGVSIVGLAFLSWIGLGADQRAVAADRDWTAPQYAALETIPDGTLPASSDTRECIGGVKATTDPPASPGIAHIDAKSHDWRRFHFP